MNQLVLSLFPGLDLFGKGFEAEGFCVVRGPDPMTGGDIREFTPATSRFDGIIGGPPCQAFSRANRRPDRSAGVEMIHEFARCVTEARPEWWLMENVPGVPDLFVAGYTWQRIDYCATEAGGAQSRLRHLQFGKRLDEHTIFERVLSPERNFPRLTTAHATVTGKSRVSFDEMCALQGMEAVPELPFFHRHGKRQAVANGVHHAVARVFARAVKQLLGAHTVGPSCECGCGRPVTGRARTATVGCRQRKSRRNRHAAEAFSADVGSRPTLAGGEV